MNNAQQTTTLYRPINQAKLDLIEKADFKKFPPRLPEQPFFNPVMNIEYARQITKNWNVPAYGSGFVTKFEVRSDYVQKFTVQNVGGPNHNELWIPAEELNEFNNNIVGKIQVVESY